MSHKRSILHAPELDQVAQMEGAFQRRADARRQRCSNQDFTSLNSVEAFCIQATNRTCFKSSDFLIREISEWVLTAREIKHYYYYKYKDILMSYKDEIH